MDKHIHPNPLKDVVPLTICFSEPLSQLELWGHPLWLGPLKVQVYGLNCQIWQEID